MSAVTSPAGLFNPSVDDVALKPAIVGDTIRVLTIGDSLTLYAVRVSDMTAVADGFLKLSDLCAELAQWCQQTPRQVETLDVQFGCPYCNGPATKDAVCERPGCVEIDAEFRKAVGQ